MKRILWMLALLLALSLTACSTEAAPETLPPAPLDVNLSPAYRGPKETTAPESDGTEEKRQRPEPGDQEFVRIRDYIPDVFVELPYASYDNFTGSKVYNFSEPFLRYGTVKKLMQVQQELKQGGLFLKIWDGFRPTSAQFTLWDAFPDARFVSNPEEGFSSHSRGNTVDVTLVYADGSLVPMPSGFDDFTELANRDYSDCEADMAANALFLQQVMESYGFKPYFGEWWHFTDEHSYPVEENFTPAPGYTYYADCSEYITMRTVPDTSAPAVCTIAANEEFDVVAWHGSFAMVEYGDSWGYVLREYIAAEEVG